MVDPIITMGYGPNSNVGTVMRWGYIGIGEIIRKAVQQLGHARREIEVIIREFSEEYEIRGNVLVPFKTDLLIKANTLKLYSRFLEVLGNVLAPLGIEIELKADTQRAFETAKELYANTLVPMKREVELKADTLVEMFKTWEIKGKADMTRFIQEFILDDDDDNI